MSAPATAGDVVRNLSALTEELRVKVSAFRSAEKDAAEKRHAADMAESRAFLRAEGSMELRKHQARVDADQAENAALVAEALVRVLRAEIRAIELRVDVGRTYSAALRAELSTLGVAP